jgi:hypothetical protein
MDLLQNNFNKYALMQPSCYDDCPHYNTSYCSDACNQTESTECISWYRSNLANIFNETCLLYNCGLRRENKTLIFHSAKQINEGCEGYNFRASDVHSGTAVLQICEHIESSISCPIKIDGISELYSNINGTFDTQSKTFVFKIESGNNVSNPIILVFTKTVSNVDYLIFIIICAIAATIAALMFLYSRFKYFRYTMQLTT